MEHMTSSPTISATSLPYSGSVPDTYLGTPISASDRSASGASGQLSQHGSQTTYQGERTYQPGLNQQQAERNHLLSQGRLRDNQQETRVYSGRGDSQLYESVPNARHYSENSEVSSPQLVNPEIADHNVGVRDNGPTKSAWAGIENLWTYGWTSEVLGCLLSVVSFIAIIIILVVHKDRPLPAWPLGITINALVAVFGVLLKTGMTVPLSEGISQLKWQWFSQQPRKLIDMEEFDAASRGPWGSFLFLFRMDLERAKEEGGVWLWPGRFLKSLFIWRKNQLLNSFAKMSALLTVLAFAMDPFTQQIVQSAPCSRESDSVTGHYSRTSNYTAYNRPDKNFGSLVDGNMAVAIQIGLMNPPTDLGATSLVPFQCATGNCSTVHFSTMAVCHTCRDITAKVQNFTSSQAGLKYTVPADSLADKKLTLYGGLSLVCGARFPGLNGLLEAKFLGIPSDEDRNVLIDRPVAAKCSMKPCIRTMSSKVQDFVLIEEEVGRYPIGVSQPVSVSDQSNPTDSYKLVNTRDDGKLINPHKEEKCIGLPEARPDHILVSQRNVDASPSTGHDIREKDNPPALWYPKHCIWALGSDASFSIAMELLDQFLEMEMVYSPPRHGALPEGTIISRRLYNEGKLNFGHIDRFMNDLSNVMTATIRRTGGDGHDSAGEYAVGPAMELTSCLLVRWPWLAYPASLVVLATVWMTIMIWQSPRGEILERGWKSSSLAVLLTDVADHRLRYGSALTEKMGGGQDRDLFDMSRNQIDALATAVDAQLVRDGDGRARLV